MDIFELLLGARPPLAASSARACYEALESLDGLFTGSIDRAAAGGASVDRLGYAFLAGYRAALQRFDPSLGRASLCATEEGGAHPRAIRTTLTPHGAEYRIDGKKTFATLASVADTLLIVASTGREGERNHLRVARVPASRAGITIRDRASLAFAPEIPHAEVVLTDVAVSEGDLLEGDGYSRLLKPFRTLEDAHVTAGWLGYLSRAASDPSITERAISLIAALRAVAERDASSPETHVLLAGVLDQAAALVPLADSAISDEAARLRWVRDKPLLEVAGTVRKLRRAAAWRNLPPVT